MADGLIRKKNTVQSKHGHEVETETVFGGIDNGVHFVRFNSRCGTTKLSDILTLGPDEGGTAPTEEVIRARIEAHRQNIADRTAYHESVRIGLAKIAESEGA